MYTQFAQDLRLARRKAGYTQNDLAHLLAIQQAKVSALEQGTKRPSLEEIVDLSLVYGRSFESFFSSLLSERKTALQNRLERLPNLRRVTAHTYNRAGSLRRFKHRLKRPNIDG